MNIEEEIALIKKILQDVDSKVSKTEDLLYKGDNTTRPLTVISDMVDNLKTATNKSLTLLEKQQDEIKALQKERNRTSYMFITIIITVLGKGIIHHYTGF